MSLALSHQETFAVGIFSNNPKTNRRRKILAASFVLAVACVLMWYARGRGWKTWLSETLFPRPASVTHTRPHDGEIGVLPIEYVAADLDLPRFGAGVDPVTLTPQNVKLYRTSDKQPIPANINTSGAGDSIVLQPLDTLEEGTQYTFEVTSGVMDTKGTKFLPYTMSFTTSNVARRDSFHAAFEKVALQHPQTAFTCLTFGPDGKLYASTAMGAILRWKPNTDGTLGTPEEIKTVAAAHQNSQRMLIGLCFDPASTADNLILWITHGQFGMEGVPDWTSKLSRLSGPNLENYQDIVVGLPRAHKDHLSNQLDFGPDGCIYFPQGSNTGMGAPDKKWAYRHERIMTAAMIRVDPKLITNPPLNVQTEGDGNHPRYNPYAPNAPVTLYATGLRLGYDALWHSDGHLYTGVNGSAADGNTPGSNDTDANGVRRYDESEKGTFHSPSVPALEHVLARPDFLFRVEKGGYYGHPNPRRKEFVLDGGNPTANADLSEVPEYPVGTQPDRNWRKPALSFGYNTSPNGLIEYKGDFFNGALTGKILVVRYSGGDDIVALTVGKDGNITEMLVGIEGFRQFLDPLDLTQDPKTGSIYVAEYSGQKLTLLRPKPGAVSEKVYRMQIDPDTRAPVK